MKIYDSKDAFNEYPPSKEWHKGKIEYFINEDIYIYSNYEIGDIVFVNEYNYTKHNKGFNHLFLIIDKNNVSLSIDYVCMLFSSNLNKLTYPSNKLIEKNKNNNLMKNSILKTDKVYKILNEQIVFKVGKIDINLLNEIKKLYNKNNIKKYYVF